MLDMIEAESGDAPTATLIILHGLGTNGNDFVPIAEELQLDSVGPVRWFPPSGPNWNVELASKFPSIRQYVPLAMMPSKSPFLLKTKSPRDGLNFPNNPFKTLRSSFT